MAREFTIRPCLKNKQCWTTSSQPFRNVGTEQSAHWLLPAR
jgi:hypothetical protein